MCACVCEGEGNLLSYVNENSRNRKFSDKARSRITHDAFQTRPLSSVWSALFYPMMGFKYLCMKVSGRFRLYFQISMSRRYASSVMISQQSSRCTFRGLNQWSGEADTSFWQPLKSRSYCCLPISWRLQPTTPTGDKEWLDTSTSLRTSKK